MKINNIPARMEYEASIRGYGYRDMAAAMCMSVGTYFNRRKNPRTLTLGELELAAKKLHLTVEDLLAVRIGG